MSEREQRIAATRAITEAQQDFLRHFVHRQVVPHPPATRALFLAPHPDDIVVGCGASLLKLLAAGVSVRLAYLTDGRAVGDPSLDERMAAVRAAEAQRVSAELGLREPILVGANERTFRAPAHAEELVGRVGALLAETDADAVFLPYLADQHPDHRYANHLLARALVATGRRPTVYGYEVWSFVPPGIVVDISSELERKQELIRIYASQFEYLDYAHLVETTARFHAPLAPGATACEVFCPFTGDAFVAAVERLALAERETMDVEVLLTRPPSLP